VGFWNHDMLAGPTETDTYFDNDNYAVTKDADVLFFLAVVPKFTKEIDKVNPGAIFHLLHMSLTPPLPLPSQ
jgi:hypothetical protein